MGMSPAKILGGVGWEGSKDNFRGAGVKKFHKILQQICENLEGWSKKFQKMPFFGQIFPFLAPNFFFWRGRARLRIFSGGGGV
jgi:hypothetical protein